VATVTVNEQGIVAVVIQETITAQMVADLTNIQSRLAQIRNIDFETLIALTQEAIAAADYLQTAIDQGDLFDFTDAQENDLITYTSGRWVNVPADEVLDAGNF
jgi:hypothetical protein